MLTIAESYGGIMESEEKEGLITSTQKLERTSCNKLGVLLVLFAVFIPVWVLSTVLAYDIGLKAGRDAALPRLPTHAITKDAIETMMDDEFFAERPENLRFMGNPRPEVDEAWNELLGKGFNNLRVPKDAARKANFTSIELDDGSGDLWATTAFYHNLHCIKYLRQAQFPEIYPATWEIMKPRPDGSISFHADHCLENLRQAIMCGGDMTLYHYYWNATSPTPKKPWASVKAPHICVNWERLVSWTRARSFSLHDGLLRHPTLGIVDPSD